MPAKTGQQYIEGLKQRPAEVWVRGERVKDVTTHPGLKGGVLHPDLFGIRLMKARVEHHVL